MRMLNLSIKRMLDILVSLISIILISPILLTILLLVKCTSKGPVLFKQERLGLHGESFQILKFRTMVSMRNIWERASI